jgi:hypothetical protein
MRSLAINTGLIDLPLVVGEFPMIPFNIDTLEGLGEEFKRIATKMLDGIKHNGGNAFFTIHGKRLKKGQTLRRGGPHIDGNYEPHLMTFGGGGWKVGQDGPAINTALHARQYNNERGGIILASNYEACLGWIGNYDGLPKTGGDCSHIKLDEPFLLERNKIYYGNNHFIHESLEVKDDVHRVFARITMPEDHEFNPPPAK